jgi:hypothetical protein
LFHHRQAELFGLRRRAALLGAGDAAAVRQGDRARAY